MGSHLLCSQRNPGGVAISRAWHAASAKMMSEPEESQGSCPTLAIWECRVATLQGRRGGLHRALDTAWLEVERTRLRTADMRAASVSVVVSTSHSLLAGITVILRFLRDTGRNWSGGVSADTTGNALLCPLPSWGYLDSLEACYCSNQLFPQMQLLQWLWWLWWLCCYSFLVLFTCRLEKNNVDTKENF